MFSFRWSPTSACTFNVTRRLQYNTRSLSQSNRLSLRGAQLTPQDYTMRIMASANEGRFNNALHYCARMKAARVTPSISVYNALMSLAARDRTWLFAWAIFDDMLHSGVKPTTTTFTHLIQAQQSRHYTNMWAALQQLYEFGIKPNPSIYTAIFESLIEQGNVETALNHLFMMKSQDTLPELSAVQDVIILTANCGYSRLAIELSAFYEKTSLRRLDDVVWMTCLASAAQNHYLDGVSTCWEHITKVLNVAPDEGICLSVLYTAARHGVPDLATDVLRVLKLTDVAWEGHHFAALIEALCRKGQLQDAFMTLHVMRTNGIDLVETTASFIVDTIQRDVDTLDSAWAIIDEIHSSGTGLGIDALNVVVEASIKLGDLQRAIGIYKAFPDYGLSPDTITYNHLLDGCIAAHHRQLGDVLLEDMKQAGVKPDNRTYEKMIYLCLKQEYYEDAFYYLEEMKGARFLPPRRLYEAIYEKCLSGGDPRKDIVVEEMKECGYEVDNLPNSITRPGYRGL